MELEVEEAFSTLSVSDCWLLWLCWLWTTEGAADERRDQRLAGASWLEAESSKSDF